MRVATYLRTGSDRDNGTLSLSHQRRILGQYLTDRGDELVAEFSDCGAAGVDAPGLQRTLEAARARRYDVLLITHPDRLGQRTTTFGEAVEALAATGVTVHSLSSPFPLTCPHAMFLLRMAAAMANAEAKEVARLHRERRLARRRRDRALIR